MNTVKLKIQQDSGRLIAAHPLAEPGPDNLIYAVAIASVVGFRESMVAIQEVSDRE